MQYLKTTICAIGFALTCANVYAEKSKIVGVGSKECGQYIAWKRENPNDILVKHTLSWMQGFLTGANLERVSLKAKSIGLPEHETISILIENYCLKNPTEKIFSAGSSIVKELVEKEK
jgi:hypothetical protein